MRGWINTPALIAAPVAVLAGLVVLTMLGGPEPLGAFTTSLDGRSPQQLHNIQRATKALDGVVVRRGETFSFNETVGHCTTDRGYVRAPAYVEGRLEEVPGGGVCQVSSTLYNAVLLAGLFVVERHPHSAPVSSVPPGRDATVVAGGPDLRFRNTLADPVTIGARAARGRLVIQIVGRNLAASETRVVVETEDVVRPISVHGGESPRTQTRYCTATVWREELREGQVVGREFISSDVYELEPGS